MFDMKSDTQRILLVDDNHQVVSYLQRALEENGYAVTAATTGTQALARINQSRLGLLILDLDMPQPDGFEVLKTVRSRLPFLRILVISGYLKGALLEAATLLGACAALEKPIAAKTLIAKVHEVLGEN